MNSGQDKTNDIYLLLKADIVRLRGIKFFTGALILMFGLLLILPLHRGQPESTKITLQIIGGLIALAGILILISALRNYNPRHELFVKMLKNQPEQIVWIYPYVVVSMPFGIRLMKMATLFVMLDNKDFHTINISEEKIERVMNTLRQLLPHATFGYSVEKEQLYKANPSLLRRA